MGMFSLDPRFAPTIVADAMAKVLREKGCEAKVCAVYDYGRDVLFVTALGSLIEIPEYSGAKGESLRDVIAYILVKSRYYKHRRCAPREAKPVTVNNPSEATMHLMVPGYKNYFQESLARPFRFVRPSPE